ncbi:hypothetical protein IH922_09565, partial [candidate division KSB1 bacterium]|nr:hypothetical protein [candidate division KSB1 bacterium]
VIVEIRDRGKLSAADTSLVTVFLDGERIEYGRGPGQAEFLPQQNPGDRELKALLFSLHFLTREIIESM